MVRRIKRCWRKFYKRHRSELDLLGDFLGALGIFVWLYCMYIFLWLVGGK